MLILYFNILLVKNKLFSKLFRIWHILYLYNSHSSGVLEEPPRKKVKIKTFLNCQSAMVPIFKTPL